MSHGPQVEIKVDQGEVETLQEAFAELNGYCRMFRESNSNRELTVLVGTWNVGKQRPPDEKTLAKWIRPGADIVAVGVQECEYVDVDGQSCESHFRSCILNVLGPRYKPITKVNILYRGENPSNPTKVATKQLKSTAGIRLYLYCSIEHHQHVANLTKDAVKTGIMDKLHNKGAVAVSFQLYGRYFCFINSHLAAHQERLDERNKDYVRIVSKMALGATDLALTQAHHYVFWMGDLNYRIDMPRPQVMEAIDVHRSGLGDLHALVKRDQLRRIMAEANPRAFCFFHEGLLTFAPTFKLRPHMPWTYDTERIPAWCDRVLYRCRPGSHLELEDYRSCGDVMTSDHRPVSALFRVLPSEVLPSRPLADRYFRLTLTQVQVSLSGDASRVLEDEDINDSDQDDLTLLLLSSHSPLPMHTTNLAGNVNLDMDLWYGRLEELRADVLVVAVRQKVDPKLLQRQKAHKLMTKRTKPSRKKGEATIPLGHALDLSSETGCYEVALEQHGVVVGRMAAHFSVALSAPGDPIPPRVSPNLRRASTKSSASVKNSPVLLPRVPSGSSTLDSRPSGLGWEQIHLSGDDPPSMHALGSMGNLPLAGPTTTQPLSPSHSTPTSPTRSSSSLAGGWGTLYGALPGRRDMRLALPTITSAPPSRRGSSPAITRTNTNIVPGNVGTPDVGKKGGEEAGSMPPRRKNHRRSGSLDLSSLFLQRRRTEPLAEAQPQTENV